ncbi:MAG: AAA family ATPase, partial [Solirubrobacteraceae bacterium]
MKIVREKSQATEGTGEDGPSLLERDAAIAAIVATLEAVQRGDHAVLLVLGTAGIGKTSVLRVGRQLAAQAGFQVGAAVGSPMESGLPFGLIGQAMVALGAGAPDDVVDLQRLGGRSARLYRLFRGLVTLAAQRPLLLALDDLQWGDPDTLELLGFACRRLAGARIMVLGSLRPEPDPASLLAAELVGSGQAESLTLAPLGREASVALLHRVAGCPLAGADSDRIWEMCAGSPLLLKAAAWQLRADGALPGPSAAAGFAATLLLNRFVGAGEDALAYVNAAA